MNAADIQPGNVVISLSLTMVIRAGSRTLRKQPGKETVNNLNELNEAFACGSLQPSDSGKRSCIEPFDTILLVSMRTVRRKSEFTSRCCRAIAAALTVGVYGHAVPQWLHASSQSSTPKYTSHCDLFLSGSSDDPGWGTVMSRLKSSGVLEQGFRNEIAEAMITSCRAEA